MNKVITFSVLAVAALAACSQERGVTGPSAVPADALAGKFGCPSSGTPLPGSLVRGGLEVNGACILDRVTVNGGVVVDPGGDLEVESSTVTGGIVVSQCGELDIDLADHAVPTGTTSTINGDIVIQASAGCTSPAFSDVDIWTARINGQVSVTGNYLGGPTICGNEITDNVTVDHVTAGHRFWIGDPDGPFGCPGNTIGGTLSVSNSSALEVESNSVAGSVLLSGSTLELNENTIGGSLICSNGTVIMPGEDSDPSGNTVHGASTC
jgi:hypothetical protein